jgi:hypothetical protein
VTVIALTPISLVSTPARLQTLAAVAIVCTGLVFTARLALHISMGYLRSRGLRGPIQGEAFVAVAWVVGGGATMILRPAPLVVIGFVLVVYVLAALATIQVSAAAQQAGMPRATDAILESRVARSVEQLPSHVFIRILLRRSGRAPRSSVSSLLVMLMLTLAPLLLPSATQVNDRLERGRPHAVPSTSTRDRADSAMSPNTAGWGRRESRDKR